MQRLQKDLTFYITKSNHLEKQCESTADMGDFGYHKQNHSVSHQYNRNSSPRDNKSNSPLRYNPNPQGSHVSQFIQDSRQAYANS